MKLTANPPERYNGFQKAVVTDLDDTLLPKRQDETNKLTPYLPKATQDYLSIENGSFPADVALIGSTGRTAESAGKLAEQIGEKTLKSVRPLDGLMVLNGASLYLNANEDHDGFPYPNADFFKKVGKHQLPAYTPYNTYLKENESSGNAEVWASTELVNKVCQWLVRSADKKNLTFEEIEKETPVFSKIAENIKQKRSDAPEISRLLIATVVRSADSKEDVSHQFAVIFFNDGKKDIDPKPMIIALPAYNKENTLYKTEDFDQVEQAVLTAFKKFTVGDEETEGAYPQAEVVLNRKRTPLKTGSHYGLANLTNRSYVEATPYNKSQAVEALLATLLPNVVRVITAGDAANDSKAILPPSYTINEDRIVPNSGVAIKLLNNKNLPFLEKLGFAKDSAIDDYSDDRPHIQLQTPETWAEGIQKALEIEA